MSNFIKIKQLETGLKSGERIIKARDYAEFVKAEDLVRDIEHEKTKSELASTEALLKAVRNGIKQGEEESRQQISDQMVKASSAAISQLTKVEKDLSLVVLNAVRKIIDDFDDDELALSMVKNGLKLVCKSQRVTVRVNPEKMDTLMQGLMSLDHNIDFLEIMPDTNLSVGECVLESDIGIVRASVEEQLLHIESSIKKIFDAI
ncbi:MAG TPA: HrpE/YscL family type III secretion apparatus protein [Leucothrix mucor]|nr:HrpE/YscL family type III secretion apparatus protein [Leucothrix mucor]